MGNLNRIQRKLDKVALEIVETISLLASTREAIKQQVSNLKINSIKDFSDKELEKELSRRLDDGMRFTITLNDD